MHNALQNRANSNCRSLAWSDTDSNRSRRTARETSKTQTGNKTRREKERNMSKQFLKTAHFAKQLLWNFLCSIVFGRISLQNGSAPFLSSYFLSLRFGLPNIFVLALRNRSIILAKSAWQFHLRCNSCDAEMLRFVYPRCTLSQETDSIASNLVRCGVASEAVAANLATKLHGYLKGIQGNGWGVFKGD